MASRARRSSDPLARYRGKRDFTQTPEPQPRRGRAAKTLAFVIQKHWASRLHYDFRLELDGVLLSWAVPKGPSLDPADKRMAVHVEDHPVGYGSFEGTIPPGQYGAGKVIVWDRGSWEPEGDARAGIAAGKLAFHLHGQKLAGMWELIRIAKPGEKQDAWLLFKKRDQWARPRAEYDVIAALPDSVITSPLDAPAATAAKAKAKRAAPAARKPAADADAQAPANALAPPSSAPAARLPARLAPQLATLATNAPPGTDWVLEPKWDGYRILTRIAKGQARLHTRNGHDWTEKMPSLATAVEALGIDSGWLDGEIVVLDADGAPDFNALQNAMDRSRDAAIVYFVFDAPFFGGHDLRELPLRDRRDLLRQLFETRTSDRVRFSPEFDATPDAMLKAACEMRLEGIVAKRADSPYVSARSTSWLKLKCTQRQEFIVVGFADRSDASDEIGTLLLGYHEGGQLHFAGNVGTGWNHALARELHATLSRIEVDRPAVDAVGIRSGRWSRRTRGAERWVRPQLVVEVAFAEWTPDGHVRHAAFKGVRHDKQASEITRERQVVAAENGPVAGPTQTKPTRKVAAAAKVGPAAQATARAPTATTAMKQAARNSAKSIAKADAKPTSGSAKTTKTTKTTRTTQTAKATKTPEAAKASKPNKASNSPRASATTPADQPAAPSSRRASPSPAPSPRAATAKPATAGAVAGVRISHPERVIDAASKTTKLELARYYDSVAERMLPHLKSRPVSLVRAPRGIAGELFFQKHPETRMPGLTVLDPALWPGHTALMSVDEASALIEAAQMNVVEFHTWNSKVQHIDQPDRIVFDLDPGEGVSWARVREAAMLTREMLTALGLQSWLKTSGGKGLHVVVPLRVAHDYNFVKQLSQAVVQHMAATLPQQIAAKSGPANRVGRVYVDYLRNGHGQTTAAAFSARARPGLGVSMPIDWDQLAELKSGAQWTVASAREYLSFVDTDPWAGYWKKRQSLTAAVKALGLSARPPRSR